LIAEHLGLFKILMRCVNRRGRRERRGITQILLSESGRDNQKMFTLYPGVLGGLGGLLERDLPEFGDETFTPV
jgi:hypothetical protein